VPAASLKTGVDDPALFPKLPKLALAGFSGGLPGADPEEPAPHQPSSNRPTY
jgi:hypothetical protein